MNFFSNFLLGTFGVIKVFALVGKSGTGKSFRAKLLADKYGIDIIIDDGLLIKGNSIIAGKSAKKEVAFLGAIKTALFDETEHRNDVEKALRKTKFKKILILGTSERMIHKIAKRLKLPAPSKIIQIEDIATENEINMAIQSRNIEGKHIIPVPTIVIQRDYSHIIYDSIKVFMKKRFMGKPSKVFEKTVVQPSFSQKRGVVALSESALTQMIIHCADEFDQSYKINKIKVKTDVDGYTVKLYIEVPYREQVSGNLHNFQKYILQSLEKHTGIIIKEVSLKVENFNS